MVTIFVFGGFAFKICNNAWVMPSFGEQFIFVKIYSMVLSWIRNRMIVVDTHTSFKQCLVKPAVNWSGFL